MPEHRRFVRMRPEDYHLRPEISHSGIKCFAKEGPLMFHARYVARTVEPTDTPKRRLGRAFHLAMADPDYWKDLIVEVPTTLKDDEILSEVISDWIGSSTKAPLTPGSRIELKYPPHQQYLALHKKRAEESGRDWLTTDEIVKLAYMIRSVYENPAAREYIGQRNTNNVEIACLAVDPKTKLGLRALLDLYLGDTVVDFKTTRQTTANAFVEEAIHKFSYNYQAEWYLRVSGAKHFKFISVRNDPPWEAMVYTVPITVIQATREANDYHLLALKDCFDSDSWHSLNWGAELDLKTGMRYAQ